MSRADFAKGNLKRHRVVLPKSSSNNKQALSHLQKDGVLKILIQKYPLPVWNKPANLFAAIIRNIIGQQLSSAPTRIITQRFINTVLSYDPKKILAVPDEKLRATGMSWAKVKYVKALAQAVSSGSLNLEKIKTFPDEEVIIELTKVKGIGRWTAEMILIFHLQRPDVFSLGDLGLRTAVSKLYKVDRNNLKKIAKISLAWSPYRSLASRYLWKSLDNE